jgi:hypothetical protein
MPEVSRFYGIVVRIFYDDYNPPHFHAEYGEHEVLVNVLTLAILSGSLPAINGARTMATSGRYDTPAGNPSFTPWLRTLGRRYLAVLGAGNVVSLVSVGGSCGR